MSAPAKSCPSLEATREERIRNIALSIHGLVFELVDLLMQDGAYLAARRAGVLRQAESERYLTGGD